MGMSLINEKELGESIATNLKPRIQEAQERLEGWVEGKILPALPGSMKGFLDALEGRVIRIRVPLGEKVVEATIEVLPKP